MTKMSNTAIIRETLALCQQDEALAAAIRATVAHQTVTLESAVLPPLAPRYDRDAEVIVSKKRSFEAAGAWRGQKTAVLNFANPIHPGGGVLAGARAQEESLCRCSTLYPCLTDSTLQAAFYGPHKAQDDSRNNDDCIHTPDVLVIREDTDQPALLPPEARYPVDVITCAAPMLAEYRLKAHYIVGHDYHPISEEELYALHLKRARRILHLAALNGAEVIILGAFGCGAFDNDPAIVSRAMMEATREYRRMFRVIEYAIYCREYESENYLAFSAAADAL